MPNPHDTPDEALRRAMVETDVPTVDLVEAMVHDEQTWTTEQLREDFEVLSFMAPFVVVKRRSDGQRGTMEFQAQPRVYFGFTPE